MILSTILAAHVDRDLSGIYPLFLFLGLIVFFILFLTIVAMWEKRMVWPYGDLKPTPPYEDKSGYGAWRLQEAFQAGFTLLGWAPQMTGPKYRVSYAVLLAPDRECLAIVGVGTIFGMRYQATWLHSPTSARRSFSTTDHQNGVHMDVTRAWLNQLVPGKPFLELWDRHKEWLQQHGATPWRFEPACAMEDFRRFRTEHFRSQAEQGYIYYLGPSHTFVRYNFRGAFKWAFMNYTIGLVRAVSSGKFPRSS
jgi:hypothetical protein